MDLVDSEKSTRRVSRTRRKVQEASPSTSVLLLGTEEQEAEVEMESGSGEVNLEAGLDVDDSGEFGNAP